MWCWWFRRDLTALVDGELSPTRAAAVRSHLFHCPHCAAFQEEVARCVAQQRRLLALVAETADIDAERLGRSLAARLDKERVPPRRWALASRLAVAAAVAGALLVLVPALNPLLIAAGVADPPPVVAEKPDLFRDYTLFEHLDALEHFETVQAVPLETPETAPNG